MFSPLSFVAIEYLSLEYGTSAEKADETTAIVTVINLFLVR